MNCKMGDVAKQASASRPFPLWTRHACTYTWDYHVDSDLLWYTQVTHQYFAEPAVRLRLIYKQLGNELNIKEINWASLSLSFCFKYKVVKWILVFGPLENKGYASFLRQWCSYWHWQQWETVAVWETWFFERELIDKLATMKTVAKSGRDSPVPEI